MRISRSVLYPKHRAFALVLVLVFVVLLVGVCLAFFSNSLLQAQVSNSSASQVKVGLLADGAVDMVVSDLKAEIATGSNDATPTGSTTKVYQPKTPADMVPYRLLAWQGNGALNNLVKISGQTFHPNVSITDSGIDTTQASANGRQIPSARWLKPLFLPPATTALPATPKWIDVTRDGSSNSSGVVGRYAFVIYNEGGLLDANVVGYHSSATTSPLAGLIQRKESVAFADLTALAGGMSQSQVDELVEWRNYATLNGSGADYTKFVLSNRTGFMRTGNRELPSGKSDGMFVSRQSLIDFFKNKLSGGQTLIDNGILQYLGTFSRSLNQPSLAPNHGQIAGTSLSSPPLLGVNQGGNDQLDANYQKLNPIFLQVRVTTPFTRNDGTRAVLGGPLVKQRFALSRLIWLTYLGPSQGRSPGDPDITDLTQNLGISQEWLNQGTAGTTGNIAKYFGLQWDSSGGFWNYNVHTGGTGVIETLDEVAAEGREPDFFEMLKASITAGALGKGGSSLSARLTVNYSQPWTTQFLNDTSVDRHVFQIAANIIDQSDVDGYPTRLRFTTKDSRLNNAVQEVRGIENLPYLYRIRNGVYRLSNPSPIPFGDPNRQVMDCDSPGPPYSNYGQLVMVQQPEIWNPHAYDGANLNRSLGNPRPTTLDLVVYKGRPSADNPTAQPVLDGSSSSVQVRSMGYGSRNFSEPPVPTATGTSFSLTDSTTEMTFSSGSASPKLYREPTLLFKPGYPSGSNLLAPSGTVTAVAATGAPVPMAYKLTKSDESGTAPWGSSASYCGVLVGRAPLSWDGGNGKVLFAEVASMVGVNQLVYQLRYTSPTSAGFVPYDEKFFRPSPDSSHVYGGFSFYGNESNPQGYFVQGLIGDAQIMGCFDPRTSRFGMLATIGNDGSNAYPDEARRVELPPRSRSLIFENDTNPQAISLWINPTTMPNALPSSSPDRSAGFGFLLPSEGYLSFSDVAVTAYYSGQISAYPPKSSKGWKWGSLGAAPLTDMLRFGLFAMNGVNAPNDGKNWENIASTLISPARAPQYYEDADGVVRRGVSAWVPYNGASSTPSTVSTTVGLPLAVTKLDNPTSPPFATGSITATGTTEAGMLQSRPIILNRPFRTVAELGYVFSDTPWKNLDFSTPESGFSPLLDAFCINDSDNAEGLVAGKVDLNTLQIPVLKAILRGAYRNEYPATLSSPSTIPVALSDADAENVAMALVGRTSDLTNPDKGPLTNLEDLVGRQKRGASTTRPIDGSRQYIGFSADLSNPSIATSTEMKNIARFRESSIRALSACGMTRTWDLMIDLIAQTGRYPGKATKFFVEGERHYWVHLAIDRSTGKVIDKSIEQVEE